MSNIKLDLKCPECNKKLRIKIKTLIDNSNISDIIDKSFFNIKCKNCNKDINVLHPLTVEWSNYSISFLEENKESKKDIKRITKDFDDFKEKLMIFESDLNDIILEFIKDFIKEKLNDENKKQVSLIRFNELREEKIIFYLFGLNTHVSIDLNFYNELLKRSKIKNVSNYIEINDITYNKYFKL